MPKLEFWYEFASTYSYIAAMRIEAVADKAGIGVDWRPFLLGPIFAAQGWSDTPFNLYPAKGRYMVRDMERLAAAENLKFAMPETFPAMGLHAARIALIAADDGFVADFSKAVYLAEFAEGKNIADPQVLGEIVYAVGHDPDSIAERATAPENKERLKAQTARAMELGLFGAPTFICGDGEMFWGNDRMEEAFAWAALHRQEGADE
ncbi:MAG: 2-hydroxychromene-2-carboxylate isomerase [Rhodobiaceae bacterium]|nr:2-hydroxychromene-2-carboxylate isomerase [Rhodobiaceae bacterium]